MVMKISGYNGKWMIVETALYKGEELFFLWHTIYGDETCFLICKKNSITNEMIVIAETYDDRFIESLNNI